MGVNAADYLEDMAERVSWEVGERWKVAEHARKVYVKALDTPGADTVQHQANAERAMGELYGAYDMAHCMGYLIDWDESRENVTGVRVDPALARSLRGE